MVYPPPLFGAVGATLKIIAAMAGQTFKAPSSIVSKMDEKNHHLCGRRPAWFARNRGAGNESKKDGPEGM